MTIPRPFVAVLIGILLSVQPTSAAVGSISPGAKLDSLIVGKTTYQNVVVRSINARTLLITHAGGMTSIRLRDLSPELQTAFNYDPGAEAAAEKAATATPSPQATNRPAKSSPSQSVEKFEKLLKEFGQPATARAEVDLRPKFFALELGVKNQGRRPSCAIFAIVSALEYQNAELNGQVEKFSEEYLIWAVRKSVQRTPLESTPTTADPAGKEDKDDGFTLSEVVSALRTYGIPPQASMPNTFGHKAEEITEPPSATITEAKNHQHIYFHHLPGRDRATRINNVVHALNAGVPVSIGLPWPNYHTLRNAFLSKQKPPANSGHAVTLVGYKSGTGRLEDTVFIFKNSWGVEWGQGGYGTVTYEYLNNYLNDAVVLEVQHG